MLNASNTIESTAKCERDCTRCGNVRSEGTHLGVVDADCSAPAVDLSKVLARVARLNPEWSHDRLHAAGAGYVTFLHSAKLQVGDTEPERDVDAIWHAHILFTEDYMKFCDQYFGYYLHHRPH